MKLVVINNRIKSKIWLRDIIKHISEDYMNLIAKDLSKFNYYTRGKLNRKAKITEWIRKNSI